MSEQNNNIFLLTLKGQITVHFMDGNILEGEFTTQDMFNLFLMVNNEPVMIPRSQIRYIKGRQGQPIKKDESQIIWQEKETPADQVQDSLPLSEQQPDELANIPTPIEYDDDDEDTVILENEASDTEKEEKDDDDDDETTFILDDALTPIDSEKPTFQLDMNNQAAFDDTQEEEDDDNPTYILGVDNNDTPLIVEPPAEEPVKVISSYIECIGGPHVSEIIELTAGSTTTIGRATNNTLPLSNDKEISRNHSVITEDMGRFIVKDQNSLNGTFVNDEPIYTPTTLKDGDVILVGVSVLKYRER